MSGHNANIKQNAGFAIEKAEPAKPVRLMLTFSDPNNDSSRKMSIEVGVGQSVDVIFGTFPLNVKREA